MIHYYTPLAGGIFLGWSLGANDASNVFGAAVAARIISFRRAAILCSMSIIAGAVLQGSGGLDTLSSLSEQNLTTMFITSLSAAFTVSIMTIMRLPVSASQAVVGAIVGVGLATGNVQWPILQKVVICWLATPFGAMLIACVLYYILGFIITKTPMSILTRDKLLWSGLLVCGVYGSYALGANNVANATGVFSGQLENVTDQSLKLIGGVAIALGVVTYSKRVMMTVGAGIMPLDAFTALVAVAGMSVSVHIFAVIGVPVSTSQAIIGAIIGIGLIRGVETIHFNTLAKIGVGWVLTPVLALIIALLTLLINRWI